ncbi:MAG TPA: hypothetical protein VNZ45_01005 [Bacteroidia bacterium]|jgi:hypothetical protein|nr:hypothetical protein [Bacteroidia bacterium]
MRTKIYIIASFLFCVIIISCEKNTVTPVPLSSTCNTSNITYANTIQGVINYDCAYSVSCHAAGSSYADFSTYEGIKEYADNGQLYEQLFLTKRMPPPPQPMLDACTLAQVKAWINSGTPQ